LWLPGLLAPGLDRERLRLGTVERGVLEVGLRAAGIVQPAAERTLTSPVASRLLRVLRHPGAQVKPGDPLLELDLSAARLGVEQLAGRLEQARLGRREAALELETTLGHTRASIEIKALELEEARFRLEQDQQLAEAGLMSEGGLRQSQTRSRRLTIELRSLEQQLERARIAGEAQLARLDAEIHSLEDEHRQRARELERAATRVQAPGVVTWVLDQEGIEIRPGDPIARVADLGAFRVEGNLSDVHARSLEVGLPVRLELPGAARGTEIQARVERVLPAVEDGALRFWVELGEVDPAHAALLRPSTRLDVHVITRVLHDTLLLPDGPFSAGPGEQEVFVLDADGTNARRRTVELGPSGQRRVAVIAGLSQGERVILSDTSDYRGLESLRIR
ncbi:MAG: HlyD family efflux transporter periplasmic adaptor subunit, partial [Holophagales bacterium]|nr:HlyD family efflux transporter periplasmic adaptor subunit [Holophagales bacterium]